jgi:hypothetical protein
MDEKKVYSKAPMLDYRMVRPKVYLPQGGNMVYQSQQVSQFMIKKDSGINFFTPNGVTMFINKARKEYDICLEIYKSVVADKLKPNLMYVVQPENLPKLYDYFESVQSCIIMIYSAIEALCNVAIPDGYTLTKKNNKGITEIWDKASIEKWTATEEKAGKIIPEILNVNSPKDMPFWENFKKLKDIRDRIIHQKQSVNKPNEIESAFLSVLLNETIFEKIKSGFDLIQYFCDMDKTHTYFPMLEQDTQVKVNFIDSPSEIPGYQEDKESRAAKTSEL